MPTSLSLLGVNPPVETSPGGSVLPGRLYLFSPLERIAVGGGATAFVRTILMARQTNSPSSQELAVPERGGLWSCRVCRRRCGASKNLFLPLQQPESPWGSPPPSRGRLGSCLPTQRKVAFFLRQSSFESWLCHAFQAKPRHISHSL